MNTKSSKKGFSVKDRATSFRYAFKGIFILITTQHNAWVHTLAAIAVIVSGIIFHISFYEWSLIIFAIGLVFLAETLNTAIEYLVDIISPEYRQKAGIIKDLAAGAVLISALTAAIIGLLIFLPKL